MGWGMQRNLKAERRQLLNAVNAGDTLDDLEQWALPLIDRGSISSSDQKTLPEAVAAFPGLSPTPIRDNQHRLIGIMLWCGGADNHYGLVIGSGHDPPPCWPIRKRLSDHIWLYDEVPGLDGR